ncbi:MAG: PQQ-binding-like beta-propeller repeat protein [Pirellulales bacterium]|nr:PQQ-binding-like beta-propeller repeat protein [Pirellulales bacterium]
MISAKIFLKVLAQKDLLPSEAIRKLKRQIEESPTPIPAEAVAKRLVKKGYLTAPLAKRMLKTAALAEQKLSGQAADQKAPDRKPPKPEESVLGFAPAAAEPEDIEDIAEEPLDEFPELTVDEPVVEKPKAKPAPAAPVPAAPPRPAASSDEDVMDGEVVEDEVVEGVVVMDAAPAGEVREDADDGSRLTARRRKGLQGLLDRILPHRRRARKENPWDSSLILIGGGSLLLLVLGGGVLIWLLFGQSGDQMLEEATKFYRQGAYTKAIDQYDRFISKYPGHKGASLAKVQRGLAQLRQAVEMTKDHAQSLAVAKEVLGKIRSEDAFGEAKGELKSLLETTAKGLSDQARQKTDPKLVAQTREAVKLIEENIVKSQRSKQLMDDIAASLQITEREIARGDELNKAIAAMDEMIAKSEPERAYNVRRALLKSYPDLIDNPQLHEAVLRVAAAEQAAVKLVEQSKPAAAPEPAVANRPAVAIAQGHLRHPAPGAQNGVVYSLADGAAYGLDAATGRVLWRRFVGYADNAARLRATPIPLGNTPGSDVLVVDASNQALVRIEAATGRVRWQQSVGEPFHAQPVVDPSMRILLAADSGRLFLIDTESGASSGFINVPQKLGSAPVVDPTTGRIYQVADHSNLYALTLEGKCEAVVYLAHEPGTVNAAPVIISRLLVVAENRGYRSATLRVLSLDAVGDAPALTEVQQIDVEGHVDAPPLVSGSRLLVTTDSGRVVAYRVSGTEDQKPLEQIAQLQTSDEPNLVRFPLLLRDQFVVADKTLTKYELQAALGTFRTAWTTFKGSAFLQPITSLGQTVFLARRNVNLPGVEVAAVPLDKPAPLWQTHLAVPLVGEPVVTPAGDVEVVTALGSLVNVPAAKLATQSTIDQAMVALPTGDLRQAVRHVLRMPDGVILLSMGAGSEQLAVFDPRRSPKQFRPIVLRDPLGANPAPMADGLLVLSRLGQVHLIDPRTGGPLAEPFQTQLTAGATVEWRNPAPVDRDSVVLSDGRDRVYRLVVKDQPARQVVAAAETTLANPIASELAVLGNLVFAADETGQLVRLRLPDLAAEEPVGLGGRATWGPRQAGQNVFLTTENDQLICLDGEGKIAWQVPLAHGPLAGPPLPVGGDFLLAFADGHLARVEGTSGRELAATETGAPLGAGPVLVGEDVLLVGNDGTLYLNKQPLASE